MVEGGEHISAEGELSEEERQMNVSKQSMQSGRNARIKTLLRQHTPNIKYNNLHYRFIQCTWSRIRHNLSLLTLLELQCSLVSGPGGLLHDIWSGP